MLFVLVLVQAGIAVGANDTARYLTFAEATETLRFSGSGLPGTALANSDAWDSWIRRQDMRNGRCESIWGWKLSISNLILRELLHQSASTREHGKALFVEGAVARLSPTSELLRLSKRWQLGVLMNVCNSLSTF